jgi:hypothetical protein
MWRICFVRSVPSRGQTLRAPSRPPLRQVQAGRFQFAIQSSARHRGEMTDAAAGVHTRAWERGGFIAPIPSAAPVSPRIRPTGQCRKTLLSALAWSS